MIPKKDIYLVRTTEDQLSKITLNSKPLTDTGGFATLTREMASLSNFGETRKERPNRSTNNGDLEEIAKHPASECLNEEGVSL